MKTIVPVLVGVSLALAFAAGHAEETAKDVLKVSIERGSLRDALNDWAQQTGNQLIAEIQGEFVAPKVEGKLTAQEALERLLEGTPLTYQWMGERLVAVKEKGRVLPAALQATSASGEDQTAIRVARLSGDGLERIRLAAADQGVAQNDQRSRNEQRARDAESGTEGLEVIVVTAQKRKERLIDVPLSISVIGAQELQRQGFVSREDYLRSIPGVSTRDEGIGLAEIVIRGAYGDRFNTGPTVGLYFGDVPLTGYAIGGSTDIKLIDMERVEVLRGPQGTLYGSNALSGAVRYIPAAPDLEDVTGRVKAEYSHTGKEGGDNTVMEGVLNLPVMQDKLALRAVAFRHEIEGYVRNTAGEDSALQASAAAMGATQLAVNKEHVGTTEYRGGRVSALWQASDALSFNLTYLTQVDTQADRLFDLRQTGPYLRADYQFGPTIGGNDDALRVDLDILNLTGEYDFGWGSLYSSSAWLDQRFIRKWDIGVFFGNPLRPMPAISTTNAEVFAQEVRFTSQWSSPYRLVAGLYYEDSSQPTDQATYFAGDPALNPFAAGRVLLDQTALDRLVEQKAAFGEVSRELGERFKLTLGGRMFDYDTRFWTRTFNSVRIPETSSDSESSESGHTLKAGAEYKAGPDALVYLSWSQGFRLGRPLATDLIRSLCDRNDDGLLDGTTISSTLDRVDSDRLDSYELGGKFALLGGRATLTASAYQNEWSDIPVVFFSPGCVTATTLNGGSARARGFETEGRLRLNDTLDVNVGLGYVDSELTATTSAGRDGDRMNFTPKFSGNVGLEYTFPIAGRNAFLRGDYSYFGSYYSQPGERGLKADSYSIVNLRAGWAATERTDVALYVDNLADSDAFTSILGPSGFPPGYGVRLRPRTVGVGLSHNF